MINCVHQFSFFHITCICICMYIKANFCNAHFRDIDIDLLGILCFPFNCCEIRLA